jgi:hypothetical protein
MHHINGYNLLGIQYVQDSMLSTLHTSFTQYQKPRIIKNSHY